MKRSFFHAITHHLQNTATFIGYPKTRFFGIIRGFLTHISMPDTLSPAGEIPELQWSAPVRAAHERSTRWYLICGGVVCAIAAYGLLAGAWSVALVAVLCGAMYFLVRSHQFPDSTMTITERGAKLDDTFMPWTESRGFWIMITPEYGELHVVPNQTRTKELVIQTGAQDLVLLRETLQRHIPALSDKQERLVDAFIRICKL